MIYWLNRGKHIFIKIGGIYFVWILLHFCASHFYVHYCIPATFTSFLMSPFVTPMPVCRGLRWLIYTGGNNIDSMWIVFAKSMSNLISV